MLRFVSKDGFLGNQTAGEKHWETIGQDLETIGADLESKAIETDLETIGTELESIGKRLDKEATRTPPNAIHPSTVPLPRSLGRRSADASAAPAPRRSATPTPMPCRREPSIRGWHSGAFLWAVLVGAKRTPPGRVGPSSLGGGGQKDTITGGGAILRHGVE